MEHLSDLTFSRATDAYHYVTYLTHYVEHHNREQVVRYCCELIDCLSDIIKDNLPH